MESKKNAVLLTVSKCRKMPDIAVVLGVKYEANHASVQKLKDAFSFDNLQSNNCLYTGAEYSALAYSIFMLIKNKMVGSPLELSRSKVSNIDCNVIGKKFLITWNTQGSISALRKTIGLALSSMNPHKLFSAYSVNIKNLGGKVDREVFNMVANKFASSIKESIKIAVVGKINVEKPKLDEMLSKVISKLPKLSMEKSVKSPVKHEEFKHSFPSIKASGITAAVVADYLKSQKYSLSVLGDEIIIYDNKFTSKQKSLSDANRVKTFVKQKYEKLGDDLSCIFAYLCITQSLCDCCAASSIAKSKVKPNDMISYIKKSL